MLKINIKKMALKQKNLHQINHQQKLLQNLGKNWKTRQPLLEKGLPFAPISPQTVQSAAKRGISPGSIENVGQGALVPVQMGPSVPV
jgi:hypothetical protein